MNNSKLFSVSFLFSPLLEYCKSMCYHVLQAEILLFGHRYDSSHEMEEMEGGTRQFGM